MHCCNPRYALLLNETRHVTLRSTRGQIEKLNYNPCNCVAPTTQRVYSQSARRMYVNVPLDLCQ